VAEENTLPAQAVDVRRGPPGVAVTAEAVGAQRVHQDDQYVGPLPLSAGVDQGIGENRAAVLASVAAQGLHGEDEPQRAAGVASQGHPRLVPAAVRTLRCRIEHLVVDCLTVRGGDQEAVGRPGHRHPAVRSGCGQADGETQLRTR